jgi:hypothetical protein
VPSHLCLCCAWLVGVLPHGIPSKPRGVKVGNRALVFAIYGPQGTDAPSGAWSFILNQIDETSTRLIARLQVATPSLAGKLIFYGFMEPAHSVMQHGMFRGLEERVLTTERHRPRTGPAGGESDALTVEHE